MYDYFPLGRREAVTLQFCWCEVMIDVYKILKTVTVNTELLLTKSHSLDLRDTKF